MNPRQLPPFQPRKAVSVRRGPDPITIVGGVLMVGLLVMAVRLGLRSDPSPTGPSRRSDSPGSATAAPTKPEPGAKSQQDGFIPRTAVEATRTDALSADPDKDPLCNLPPSMVRIGKSVGIPIERELRAATAMSDEEESQIGNDIEVQLTKEADFRGKLDLAQDVARYAPYVKALVGRLATGAERKGIRFRVHMLRDPSFNAAALVGGVMMVHTGLFDGQDAVQDEAELVAILGHEIAHVDRRHCAAVHQYVKALGDVPGTSLVVRLSRITLSSEYEHEADDRGNTLAIAMQYNPQAAVRLWGRMHQAQGSSGPGGLAGQLGQELNELGRSHPASAERACRAMRKVNWARENANWTRLYDGKTNLRNLVPGPDQPH